MSEIWPDPSLSPVELEVPAGTVAVVYMMHGEDGSLLAHYAEARDRVPAERGLVADALLELVAVLLRQSHELDQGGVR